MSAPYRERACGVCGTADAPWVRCAICGRDVCAGCHRDGACDACMDRATELVLRRLASRGPSPLGPSPSSRWATALRVTTVGLLTAIALSVVPLGLRGRSSTLAGAGVALQPVLVPASVAPDVGAPDLLRAGPILLRAGSSGPGAGAQDLWLRAKRLAADGVLLTLVDVRAAADVLEARPWEVETAALARTRYARGQLPDGTPGLMIPGVSGGSFLASLGLRSGDVVTSVDGLTVDELPARTRPTFSVVEVLRGRHRIVLGIHSAAHMK